MKVNMINQERLTNLLKELVEIDSPSQREGAVAKVIREKLENLGFDVKEDDAGKKLEGEVGNLVATLKGSTEGTPIGFSAHMDTVQPGEGIQAIVEDGILKSAGDTILGSDDKAGIAAFLEAAQVIKENNIPHGDIQAIFTIWEEGGLNGSRNLDYSLVKAHHVFVMDSGGPIGSIINQGPAQDRIAATFKGKAAHAGAEPEAGISAIQIAARAIDHMKLLRVDDETTANIGNINGGGATNIVPDKVNINGEARSLKDDKLEAQTKSMVEAMEKAASDFGGEVELDVKRLYTAFKLEESDPMISTLKEIFTEMGMEPVIAPSGGGSDTNHFNANGLKAVNLSVGMNKVHTVDEYIKIEDLANGARMVMEIIKKYA